MNEIIRNLQLDILATEVEVLNLKQELLNEINEYITELGMKDGDEYIIEDLDEFIIDELKKLHALSNDPKIKTALLKIDYNQDLRIGTIKYKINNIYEGVK